MFRRILAVLGGLLLCGLPCIAGSIIITGHDPDFHAQSLVENPAGAQNFLRLVTNAVNITGRPVLFVTDPAALPGTNPYTAATVACADPCFFNSLPGVVAALGSVQTVDVLAFADFDLSTVGAIVVGSDFGGNLTSRQVAALAIRKADLAAWIESGGGMVVLSEQGRSPYSASDIDPLDAYSFLPFSLASLTRAANQYEGTVKDANGGVITSGFSLTSYGSDFIHLSPNDINDPATSAPEAGGRQIANYSHVWFDLDSRDPGFPDFRVIDVDAQGRVVTFEVEVVPEPATFTLLLSGVLALAYRRKRLSTR